MLVSNGNFVSHPHPPNLLLSRNDHLEIKIVYSVSLCSGTQHDLAGTASVAFKYRRQVLGDQMPKWFLAKRLGRGFLSGSVEGFKRAIDIAGCYGLHLFRKFFQKNVAKIDESLSKVG